MNALYTIGHSNHALDVFVSLLRKHDIGTLVDVRSRPYSRYCPHFSKDPLSAGLIEAGFQYEFMGRELGGQPEGDGFYDEKGRALYWRMAERPAFRQGLDRLKETLSSNRIAIMCSEEDPSMCHRRHLITRVLVDEGVSVLHIRGEGGLESEQSVREAETTSEDLQMSLFGDDASKEGDRKWKSIQSGLQKNPQQSSLGS